MKLRHALVLAVVGRYLIVLGVGSFSVVILTHVCEAFHWCPAMGWGLKHSAGHYLDLSAAILTLTFLPAGFVLWLRAK